MNIHELTDGQPSTKPWLNIVAATVTAGTVQADVLTANSINTPVTTAFISKVAFQALPGVQAAADILVGLSPNSRLTIPANSLFVGDVYRLRLSAEIDAPVLGNSATFDFGSIAAGPITSFPIVAAITPLPGVPIIGALDMVVASPTTINTITTIGGFVFTPGGPVFNGFSFSAAGVPFDTSVDQTFTFTYSTPDFASASVSEIVFARFASGSAG